MTKRRKIWEVRMCCGLVVTFLRYRWFKKLRISREDITRKRFSEDLNFKRERLHQINSAKDIEKAGAKSGILCLLLSESASYCLI